MDEQQEEIALLRAIRADPDDSETRLVYADWLEERDDALRAEYLRLQVQLCRLQAQAQQLDAQFDRRWRQQVGLPPTDAVRLRVGGTIRCQSIRQGSTYAGLLEGLPTRQMNERTIERLLQEERERGWWAGEPYLVPPVVTPIEYRQGEKYPFGDPEALPGVTCVARYAAPSAGAATAELTVIWFQDGYAFPIDPGVRAHLEAIDWAARAIVIED